MKWSNRIAHGFSPGWATPQHRPESGDRMCGVESRPDVTNGVRVCDGHAGRKGPTRSPLSGRSSDLSTPGLKPWAILLDHFMVKNPQPSVNQQLLTTDHSPLTTHHSLLIPLPPLLYP